MCGVHESLGSTVPTHVEWRNLEIQHRYARAAPSVLVCYAIYPWNAHASCSLQQTDPDSALGLVSALAPQGCRASLAFAQILPA